MKQRKVKALIEPESTTDGAGVKMKRAIATRKLSELDPFLLLDHFGSTDPNDYIAGFPMHPHRGIETVTYMLKGLIKHRDSNGNEGVISSGGIQWMTAGSGIMHEEMPAKSEGEMEGFQLWVNLPAEHKMMKPRYREFGANEIPFIKGNGAKIKVIAGEVDGIKGAISDIEAAPTYLDVELDADASFEHQIEAGHNVCAYLFAGEAGFEATSKEHSASDNDDKYVHNPRLVIFDEGDYVRIRSGSNGARFLLISGKPLNEPIARYGPFVMNTREEIQQAIADLQRGTFVKSYE